MFPKCRDLENASAEKLRFFGTNEIHEGRNDKSWLEATIQCDMVC